MEISDNKTYDFSLTNHHILRKRENLSGQIMQIKHLVKCSCKMLNNKSTCALSDSIIETLSDASHQSQESTYDAKLKTLLSKKNVIFKTQLDILDSKQFVRPLPCSAVKSYCPTSENFSEGEFSEFMEMLKKQKSSSTIWTPLQQTNRLNPRQQIIYPGSKYLQEKTTDIAVKKQSENSKLGVFNNCFKTAKEELEIQCLQKYGTAPQYNEQSNGIAQKRKFGRLGNRRNKFIPPLLSNSGSNEDVKTEESADIDERLKNIEPKMVELIKSEIMDCSTSLHWNDIAGLSFAKKTIQEAVVWPMLRPDIFTGLRRPPKGILLFGPPGTGKTLIGKCVASQSKSTFFSISASSLTSKWVGDGEKMVRALFAVARVHQPSVIFIDEVDSLLSQRTDTEHESTRRIKTEFLVQLDGATTDAEESILVIGATNRPQELDEAARRRFVKRLYIPLPECEARLQLVQKLISPENHKLEEEDFKKVAALTNGYSGADIKNLCSEASLGPIRSIDMNLIEHIQASEVRPLLMDDFLKALTRVKSSVAPKDLESYITWDGTYGSGF